MPEAKVQRHCIAFQDSRRIAAGEIKRVAAKIKEIVDQQPDAGILVFDAATSETVELDLRGTLREILEKLAAGEPPDPEAPRGPGRPRLGVVAREVTLLPRHWDWLARQPGGASVALRKLVEEARHANAARDKWRSAQESAYRFMTTMAGDLPGFEEATRALYAGNQPQFQAMVASWPTDVRNHAKQLAAAAFAAQ